MSKEHTEFSATMDYRALVESILRLHQQSVGRAAIAVDQYLVLRNWAIGAYIVDFEQSGKDHAQYGQGLLRRLAADLAARAIKGVSPDMLERMRLFFRLYPQIADCISAPAVRESLLAGLPTPALSISAPAVRKSVDDGPPLLSTPLVLRLSWTHLVDLVRIDDPWKRAFYETECLKGSWSKRQLQRQIGSLLYERTGLSTDKRAVIEEARQQIGKLPEAIADLIRDPYILEFAGLAERAHYRESDLESALLDHLQNFLLELGSGFCFEARQRRVTVGTEHDYIDLVFYHRRLRCHLLIDLKIRAFKHADAGQMNFYLNYWKKNEIEKGDNPPVGLLLCSDKSATRVEYATAGLDHQLFVSRYLVALPSADRLRELVEADRAAIESAENSLATDRGEN
jgi:predicted nuclease of restriction endonuclease-like (RecB) superfamily